MVVGVRTSVALRYWILNYFMDDLRYLDIIACAPRDSVAFVDTATARRLPGPRLYVLSIHSLS